MYAIIENAGRQYKVSEGDVIDIDLCDQEDGCEMNFSAVKLLEGDEGVKVGKPNVDGASVTGQVIGTVSGPKVLGISFRRRKGSKKTKGHRQDYTRVKITGIKG